jgi:predicted transcriptional regulator
VSIDDSGADREVSIDDSGADREVSIDDSVAAREVSIDDSGADKEVSINDSGADKEVSIDDSGADREVSIDDSGADREVSINDISASHSSALIDGIISAAIISLNDNSTIDGSIGIFDSTIDSSVSMEGTVLYNDGDALHTPIQQRQQQQQKFDEDINMLEKGGRGIINILPPSEAIAIVQEALKQQVDKLTCDLQCTRRKIYELTETIAALKRERSSMSFEHSDMLLFFIVLHLIMYFASVERFDVEDFIAVCLCNAHVVVDKLQYLFPTGKKATLHFVFKQ